MGMVLLISNFFLLVISYIAEVTFAIKKTFFMLDGNGRASNLISFMLTLITGDWNIFKLV